MDYASVVQRYDSSFNLNIAYLINACSAHTTLIDQIRKSLKAGETLEDNHMNVVFVLLFFGGIAAAFVGLVMLIINLIKKKSIKTSGIILGAGAACFALSIVISGYIDNPDYTVTNASEGHEFIQNLESGKSINGKTLKFKVTTVGKNEDQGIGLQAPGDFDVIVPYNKNNSKIKTGDTVEITCNSSGKLFNIWVVSGTIKE